MSLEKKKKLRQKRRGKTERAKSRSGGRGIDRAGLVAALLGTLLYINTWQHGYVLDDFSVIKENWVTQQGTDGIGTIWKTAYRYGYWNSQGSLYRPLTLTLFAIEWEIAPDSPSLPHLINILLYALLAYLLYILLSRLLSGQHPALPLITSLLFVAHPLHTEVVANIKSCDEILSFIFGTAAVLLLLRYLQCSKKKHLLASLFMYACAMFSKEGAITFLAFIPILLWFFTDLKPARNLSLSALYLVPALIYTGIRNAVLGAAINPKAVGVMDNMLTGIKDTADRFATEVYLLGKHLFMAVFPHPLVCDYSIRQIPVQSFQHWEVWLSLFIFIAMITFILMRWKRKDIFAFALAWYIAGMVLYSNTVITIGSHFAERFQFVSSLGFCLFVALLLVRTGRKSENYGKTPHLSRLLLSNKLPFALTALILITYSYATISRNKEWKSDYLLYSHDVKKSPNSARTHYYFGLELMKTKALNAPSEQLKHLGAIYFNSQQFEKALEVYQEALRYNPRYADAYQNMGSTLATLGRTQEAIASFKKGLEYEPNNPYLNKFLGITYQNLGDKQNAEFYLNRARALGARME
ncbi:MAG: tetratricopeptide repeat protein [Flavobacteriales bacterium]